MPRRTLYLLVIVPLVSLLCYNHVQDSRYIPVLARAMKRIEKDALEEIAGQTLFEGAMAGMVGQLDEYSHYIPPQNLDAFHEELDQQFGGVGMEVGIDPQTRQLIVLSPLVGTPAAAAGVRSGDCILKIDGESTVDMSLQDAVERMRGRPGEAVNVTLLHEGSEEPVDLRLVRAVIQKETVVGDTRNPDGTWNYFLEGADKIGYLRITSFAENTGSELRQHLQWLTEQGMRGLILDLRNNPGGLLEAACEVADLFLQRGDVIVTTRNREGVIQEGFVARENGPFSGFPMAVLVNHYSASASEIVSAALQDHQRAVVVGQRTWGKGTVQEVIELDDPYGAMALTTASYWRPSGRNIHRTGDASDSDDWGVRPGAGDEIVLDDSELASWLRWRLRRDAGRPMDESTLEETIEGQTETDVPAEDAESPPGDVPPPAADRQLRRALEGIEGLLALPGKSRTSSDKTSSAK